MHYRFNVWHRDIRKISRIKSERKHSPLTTCLVHKVYSCHLVVWTFALSAVYKTQHNLRRIPWWCYNRLIGNNKILKVSLEWKIISTLAVIILVSSLLNKYYLFTISNFTSANNDGKRTIKTQLSPLLFEEISLVYTNLF